MKLYLYKLFKLIKLKVVKYFYNFYIILLKNYVEKKININLILNYSISIKKFYINYFLELFKKFNIILL